VGRASTKKKSIKQENGLGDKEGGWVRKAKLRRRAGFDSVFPASRRAWDLIFECDRVGHFANGCEEGFRRGGSQGSLHRKSTARLVNQRLGRSDGFAGLVLSLR